MLRVVTSWILTLTVTLSQAGLPVHMHYCKGMLESFGFFVSAGCNDHQEDRTDSCCTKSPDSTCQSKAMECCNDEVKVLLQEFDSLLPLAFQWVAAPAPASGFSALPYTIYPQVSAFSHSPDLNDTGPPIYIRFHSLIYYA